jgi:hypothetical protein
MGNDEIRCTLINKEKTLHFGFPYKLKFQRYIVDRPNLLKLEVKMIGRQHNPYLKEFNMEIAQHIYEVDVWCKTDEYWPLIEIDTRLVAPGKAFKLMDLSMMLPEGMWLHRKYDKMLQQGVISLGENFNYFLSNTLYPVKDPAEEAEEGGEEVDLTDFKSFAMAGPEEKKLPPKTSFAPFFKTSARRLMQAKNEGADQKALKILNKKGPKPKGGQKTPPAGKAAEKTPAPAKKE